MQDQEYIEIQLIYQLMLLESTQDQQALQDSIHQIYTYAKILNEAQNTMDHDTFIAHLKAKYIESGHYSDAIQIVKEQLM